MSFTGDLLEGLAQHIATAGIATYRPAGAYVAGETAIAFAGMPPDPDRVIVVSAYAVTDDATLSDSVVGVQVRCRGLTDPRDVELLADAVFGLLHGAHSVQLGAVHVVQALRNSSAPLGQDDNNRWEHTDNYYLTVHRPSTNRT